MVWTISCYHVRMNKAAPHTLAVCDQKFLTCFPACKHNQIYNLKPYIIPIKIAAQCCVTRSSVGSLETGEKGPQDSDCATSSYPDNLQR